MTDRNDMNLSNERFGKHHRNMEKRAQKAVHSKRRKHITAHYVMNIDDQLKFAKLMKMLATPTWQGGAK
jgi:hypothetical protein